MAGQYLAVLANMLKQRRFTKKLWEQKNYSNLELSDATVLEMWPRRKGIHPLIGLDLYYYLIFSSAADPSGTELSERRQWLLIGKWEPNAYRHGSDASHTHHSHSKMWNKHSNTFNKKPVVPSTVAKSKVSWLERLSVTSWCTISIVDFKQCRRPSTSTTIFFTNLMVKLSTINFLEINFGIWNPNIRIQK